LPELPEGWTWASMDQLMYDSSYGTSVKCSYDADGDPVLRIPNVVGGKLNLTDLKFATVNLELEPNEYLEPGDIIVVRTNGSIRLVGRAAAISQPLNGRYYYASYLLRLRCINSKNLPDWISNYLASWYGRQWIEQRAASSAGQHNISLSTLLTLPLPLPSDEEQSQSFAMLQTQIEELEHQEQAVELGLKQAEAQRKNILKAAFSGQLVAQDPNDEPASVLLERIRAEREERALQPKPRKAKAGKQEVQILMKKLVDVLAEAGDWITAEEAFRRCGVTDGTSTERIEELYAELRELVKAEPTRVEVEREDNSDKLKLTAHGV
jgi:type I restriction enzyme, S subunit